MNWVNEGKTDRMWRIILGVIFLILGFVTHYGLSVLFFILAVLALFTGLSGNCLIYRLFGINTCRRR